MVLSWSSQKGATRRSYGRRWSRPDAWGEIIYMRWIDIWLALILIESRSSCWTSIWHLKLSCIVGRWRISRTEKLCPVGCTLIIIGKLFLCSLIRVLIRANRCLPQLLLNIDIIDLVFLILILLWHIADILQILVESRYAFLNLIFLLFFMNCWS